MAECLYDGEPGQLRTPQKRDGRMSPLKERVDRQELKLKDSVGKNSLNLRGWKKNKHRRQRDSDQRGERKLRK